MPVEPAGRAGFAPQGDAVDAHAVHPQRPPPDPVDPGVLATAENLFQPGEVGVHRGGIPGRVGDAVVVVHDDTGGLDAVRVPEPSVSLQEADGPGPADLMAQRVRQILAALLEEHVADEECRQEDGGEADERPPEHSLSSGAADGPDQSDEECGEPCQHCNPLGRQP